MAKLSGVAAYRARVATQKRGDILDAGVSLFLEQGYDRTTLEAVAKAARVSTGTLFKHYPTKARLFGAIMARAWENEPGAEGAVPPPGDPERALTAIGADYARLLREPHTEALTRVIVAEATRFPELGQELYLRGKEPYLKRLWGYLESETKAGTLRMKPDQIPIAARELLGMINDQIFWPRLLIVDLDVPEKMVKRVVASAVETFLARYRA